MTHTHTHTLRAVSNLEATTTGHKQRFELSGLERKVALPLVLLRKVAVQQLARGLRVVGVHVGGPQLALFEHFEDAREPMIALTRFSFTC